MESTAPGRMGAQSFLFEGRLNGASFTAFARHRAARLDLRLDVETQSDRTVCLSVDGRPELIDMFEMAMTLGPHDCIVLDVTRTAGRAA